MRTYVIRRLLQMIPTLLMISFIIFGLLYLTPGDPVHMILGAGDSEEISPETYAMVREELGLDRPFYIRYMEFVGGALRGDLGKSYLTGKDVFDEIMDRMPATVQLTIASMLISIVVSIPLGIFSALHRGSIWDSIATFLATLSVSLPKFWFALVLIIVFSLKLGWLPSMGIGYVQDGIGSVLSHLILPATSLGLGLAATQTRMIRSSMLDVLGQDYIRFAKSKGLKEHVVLMGHAMKNALIPVITVFGAEIGSLLSGAVVTETIFAWPGVGRLIVNSISRRDYPMIQGSTLLVCTLFLLINLLVDICYAWLNPKIRLDK